MKEFEVKAQSRGNELTPKLNPSTLEGGPRQGRGKNIFMPEPGKGEQPSVNPESKLVIPPSAEASQVKNEKQVTPEMVQKARDAWNQLNSGKNISVDERRTQEDFIRMGVAPMAGGAEAVRVTDYSDLGIQNIAHELNTEVGRVGTGNPLSPIYIDRQINRIQGLIDKGQVDSAEAIRLLGVLNTWMAESQDAARAEQEAAGGGQRKSRDTYADLESEIVNHIQNTPNDLVEKKRFIDLIKAEVNRYSAIEAGQFPEELLRLASHFKETRETLINRILFRAYEDSTETNDYRESMTLYAQSNLDILLGYLSKIDPENYRYFVSLRTAASLFHDMNVQILGGNLDQFIGISQRISYAHFELMKKISGAPDVMRLYEEKYNEYLSRYGRITTEGYSLLKKDVEKSMRILNEKGQVKSDYIDERGEGDGSWKMDEWEIQRALNVGRTFFNITFRGAEQIASGQVPRKGSQGEKQWASFPQESAVRIMNWIQWMTFRFQIADTRGGMEFLEMVKGNYKEFLGAKKRKLGINKIKEFGGMNTDELEVGAMFGVSGIYSSWRAETMAFPVIKVNIGGNGTTIREWLDQNAKQIDDARKSKDQDRLFNVLRPLIDNSNLALGILLKHGIVSEQVGYKSREALWRRAAESNLPLMINYLSRIQFDNEKQSNNRVSFLKQNDATNWDEIIRQEILEDGTTHDITRWDILSEKIFLQHHRNIKKAAGIDVNDIEDQSFDADEQRLRNLIIEEGKNLAPHLADIVFPYVPFMNDVPFELLDYAGPGEEFFKRRTGGDLPSFNKAEGAFVAIMNNPGGIGRERALEQFDAIVKGIEGVQGTGDAQERIFPMLEAYVNWITTKPWRRQAVLKFLAKTFRKPTSIAQEYAGTGAESLDENDLGKLIDESAKIGVISLDLADELKKKKNVKFLGLLWLFIRDILPISIAAVMVDFGQKASKEKGT